MKFVFTPCSIKNELFTKRGYFMLISLFIFYHAGMGYEYLKYIYINIKKIKKIRDIIISKKSIIHTPQSERTRFAKVYAIYSTVQEYAMYHLYSISVRQILYYWLKRSNTLLNTRNMMWKNNNTSCIQLQEFCHRE